MIQEYLAVTIFALSLLYSGYQLSKIILPGKNKELSGCGSGNCGCPPVKKHDISKRELITTDLKAHRIPHR